jgi:hypothetical protein
MLPRRFLSLRYSRRLTVLMCCLLAGIAIVVTILSARSERPTVVGLALSSGNGFVVKGDWGSGSVEQSRVTRQMCELRKTHPYRLVLTTGDNFYSPDGQATRSNFEEPEACLLRGEPVEWRPAWGNHDLAGGDTLTQLRAPPGERYYAWEDRGIAFFAYDGNEPGPVQALWLREAVCGSAAAIKVIYGHQPAYSIGKHGSDLGVRQMVHPVARDCGVRLVLAGHDHLYSRSHRIEGVVYVVTGGGGSGLYRCGPRESWLAVCLSEHHFLYLLREGDSLTGVAVAANGTILDRFSLS